jgi:hypothetical protein
MYAHIYDLKITIGNERIDSSRYNNRVDFSNSLLLRVHPHKNSPRKLQCENEPLIQRP